MSRTPEHLIELAEFIDTRRHSLPDQERVDTATALREYAALVRVLDTLAEASGGRAPHPLDSLLAMAHRLDGT